MEHERRINEGFGGLRSGRKGDVFGGCAGLLRAILVVLGAKGTGGGKISKS